MNEILQTLKKGLLIVAADLGRIAAKFFFAAIVFVLVVLGLVGVLWLAGKTGVLPSLSQDAFFMTYGPWGFAVFVCWMLFYFYIVGIGAKKQ